MSKYLKHKEKYYNHLNELMQRLNLQMENIKEDKQNKSDNSNNNNIISECKYKSKCQICNNKEYIYICPKCKLLLCSLECYKKHNADCTEEFYKSNVIEELKATKEDEEQSKKFKAKLKKIYDDLNIEDINNESISVEKNKIKRFECILYKLDKGTFDFNDLTPNEWKDFMTFINSGADAKDKIGEIYNPFWKREPQSFNIIDKTFYDSITDSDKDTLRNLNINQYICKEQEQEEEEEEEEKDFFNIIDSDDDNICNYITLNNKQYKITYSIINISIILKYEKIPLLSHNATYSQQNHYQLLLFVMTTIYIFRLFNGECGEDIIIDINEYIMRISPLLYEKANSNDIPFDILSTWNYFINKISIFEGKLLNIKKNMIKSDLIYLLKGKKFFIFESLIRLYELIHSCAILKVVHSEIRKKCISSKYKLIYFMSYLKTVITEEDIIHMINAISNI